MADATFPRVPNLLGPIFEEAGTGDRQCREALFLTFNVDLGFFEARLLGPVRATGAAVTVVADSGVFTPDPRNVRSAGHSYALGLAAMSGAFHPKLTVLAGPHRALIGIGSGNLTIGGWHANDEVLNTIRASREEGVPAIVGDLVDFLRELPTRVVMSPLAVDGIARTADQLAALIEAADAVETGHRLVGSVRGPILEQLPSEHVDKLELIAPFHDLGGKALAALIDRYQPERITVLAQRDQAVMDPAALQRTARDAGRDLKFVQLEGEESFPTRYRHGKVVTALRGGVPVWSLVGSPNLSAAALLKQAPAGNCELAVFTASDRSLLPAPTVPVEVEDVPALMNAITGVDDDPRSTAGGVRLLEARTVDTGIEVILSSAAVDDMLVEVSPYVASPDYFDVLGVIPAHEHSATFPGLFTAGTRIRVGEQLQFLAFPDQVVDRMRPVGVGRPNRDATVAEIFSSDIAAAQWHDALTRLLLSHGQTGRSSAPPASQSGDSAGSISWRTLDDANAWATYSEDALARLGMPIFQLAVGSAASPKPVGGSLPNAAPAWEDRFEETSEAFEEGETAESAEQLDATEPAAATELSPHQRSRLRRWMADLVGLMPQLGPLERIAVCQLATAGSSASIWDAASGSAGWFDPLSTALQGMARDDWPSAAASQAAAVVCVGLYRLGMAVPSNERGADATRFFNLARSLGPLIQNAPHESVADNLELLAGTSFVARSADDVIAEVEDATSSGPDRTLIRILERLLPELDIVWVGNFKLLLTGRATNPKGVAAQAFANASAIPRLAVGVNGSNGAWVVVVRIPDRVTVVEGGRRPTTYKTYDTSNLLNPVSVLTDQELAQANRISSPPFTKAGAIDLEVLDALGVTPGQVFSTIDAEHA